MCIRQLPAPQSAKSECLILQGKQEKSQQLPWLSKVSWLCLARCLLCVRSTRAGCTVIHKSESQPPQGLRSVWMRTCPVLWKPVWSLTGWNTECRHMRFNKNAPLEQIQMQAQLLLFPDTAPLFWGALLRVSPWLRALNAWFTIKTTHLL